MLRALACNKCARCMCTHGVSHFPCSNTFLQLSGDIDVQHDVLQYQAMRLRHKRLCCLQIWVKPSAEMQYMYGNHVMKSGLGRITENTPAYTGVVIYSMSDIPLGFGVTAKSTADCRKMDPSGIVVFHQADVGEFTSIVTASRTPAQQFAIVWLCVHVRISCCVIAGEYLRNEDEL